MKLFLESANAGEIREAGSLGLIEGIMTTPSRIAAEGRGLEEVVREICAVVECPVAVTAVSRGWEELVEEARSLARIHRSVVVSIPANSQGLRAIRRLSTDGVRTNATLVCSPMQAMLAARSGAALVSPSLGRLDDAGNDGTLLIERTLQIYNNYNLPTQVVVADARNPGHVLESAIIGADACAVSMPILEQLVDHPLTDAGMQEFLADWGRVPKN